MVRFYLNGNEENIRDGHLSLRCDYLVSFDGGKTRFRLRKNAAALRKAYELGAISFSYEPYNKCHMFTEICQSNDEVSHDVLDEIASIAKEKKVKLPLAGIVSLVNHPSVLEWLLKKGIKCKHVNGHGKSTMVNLMMKKRHNEEYADEIIALLKQYKAVDKKYIKKHKDEWDLYTISAFTEEKRKEA